MYDDIIRTLNIKEENLLECHYAYKNKHNYYTITLVSRGAFCPYCGAFTKIVHGYRKLKINHAIYLKEDTTVIYKQRRYICPYCKITKSEENPFQSNHPKLTYKTIHNILELLKDYNETFSSVARRTNTSITVVQTIFDEHVQIERKTFPEAICLDEFYFSNHAKNKYALMFISFKNGLVLDILKSRHKSDLRSYFRTIPIQERNNVKYITMDLYDNYRSVCKIYFQNAILCADAFHVIKDINDCLNSIRLKVMHKFEKNKKSDEYYLLKHKNKLLFINSKKINDSKRDKNNHFHQTLTDGQLLELLLSIDLELKKAYALKEQYMIFNNTDPDTYNIVEYLEEIITDYTTSDIEGFIKIGNTLKEWKQEIINSFIKYDNRRLSNGPIEGRNKYVKIILGLANGYYNFERFRNRAMYVLNKFEPYVEEILDYTNIRLKGKSRGKYNTKK